MRELFFYTKEKMGKIGRISVAGIYNCNQIAIGVAVCGKKDVFTRKIGRVISRGRAVKDPLTVIEVKNEKLVTETFVEKAKEIVDEIVNNKQIKK